ncbi:MAG: hypothetical protein HRU70_00710 [Phycisphaeraceae bacterium]|nr:MAG: hypothetical protein HRU70_00710 [Phycisphaeraceae bacterium]
MTIRSASDGDPGVYDCVVTLGTCGSLTSHPATLTLDDAPCPPDFNSDGFLDFFDLDAFVMCFESGDCPPGSDADFNGDAFVDFFDLDAFIAAFEDGC